MDIASFETALQAEGYGNVETRQLPAAARNAEHAHPFDVRALVLDGQISLGVSGQVRTYSKGEVFTMPADCGHTEEIGAEGVRYVVGRRTNESGSGQGAGSRSTLGRSNPTRRARTAYDMNSRCTTRATAGSWGSTMLTR